MKWFSIEKYLTEKSAFENDLQRRLFYTRLYLDAVLVFSLLTLISRLINGLPYSPDLRRAVGTAVTMVALITCASIAIRVFRRQLTINALLWLNLVAVLFFIFLREGAFSPFIVGVPVVIFLAGFLIRPIYSIVFSIIAVAGYSTIVIGQASGWIRQPLRYLPQEVPLAGIIVVCSAFLVTAFIGWFFAEGLLRRRRAKEESEKRYRLLVDSLPDPVLLLDRSAVILHANPAALHRFGYRQEELVGQTGSIFLPPAARIENFKKILDDFRAGRARIFEMELITQSGERFMVEVNSNPIMENGTVESVIAIFREITDRKRMETALKANEELYRTLAETSQDYIFIVGKDLKVRYVNSFGASKAGLTVKGRIEIPLEKIFPPETYEQQKTNLLKVIESGEMLSIVSNLQFPGGEVWADSRLIPLKNANGDVDAVLGVTRDITEWRRMEDALRASEKLYRSLAEEAKDYIFIVDRDLKFKYMNSFAASEWKVSQDEIVGKPVETLFPPDIYAGARNNLRKVFETGQLVKGLDRIVYPRGAIWADTKLIPLKNENGEVESILGVTRDISEHKRAEESLRESEERYRNLIEASPDAIILSDMTTGVIMANRQAAVQQHVDSPEKLVGVPLLDFIAPDDKQKALDGLDRLMKRGDVAIRQYNVKRRDGSAFVGEISGIILKDAKDNPQGILTFVRDITERKLAEDKVRESEERYRRLFDDAPYGIVLSDRNLKIAMANKQAALNYLIDDPERLVGMGIFDFLTDEEKGRAEKYIERTLQEGRVGREEYRILRENGSTFLAEVSGSTLKDPSGDVQGFLLFIRDITLRREAEDKIKESEERYRILVETSPDSIVLTDVSAKVIMANKQSAIMYGLEKAEDLLGLNTFDFIAPEDRQRAVESSLKVLKEGAVIRQEYKILRKDGTFYIGEINANILRDAKGTPVGFVGITRDITERKRIQEQLILADRMASLGQLVTGIAHEFNNVMAGIRGYAQLSQMPGRENRLKELPDMVIEMVDRGQAVTENLLGFSERFYPSIETVKPADYIQSIIKLIRKDLEMGRITVDMKVPRDFALQTDGSKFQQVLLNLITNACHAMPDGGILSFNISEEAGKMRLKISDTGTGIPQESLKRVFEPFFTTKGPLGGSSLPGSGLGLSLSYGIVQSLGGNIEVESKVGEGSTFSIVLPLQKM